MNFDDIQKNWKMQQAPAAYETGNIGPGSETLKNVKALQRKVLRNNIFMTVTLCLTVVGFFFALRPLLNPNTIWYDVGMGTVFGTALLWGALQWLKSMPWRTQIALNIKVYMEQALKNIRYLNNANKRLAPFFMVLILIGINLVYLDIFWYESFQLRLVMHIELNAIMIVIGGLTLYYSKKHNDDSYEPIIKELEELQQQFNEI